MAKRLLALVTAIVMLACLVGCATSVQSQSNAESVQSSEALSQASDIPATEDDNAAFPSWNEGADSLAALVAYVEAATEEGGAGFVPPEDRVAVFDMDGTFLCERAPVYTDYMLLLHRVQDDSAYTPTEEMVELCDEVRDSADEGVPLADADRDYNKNDALAESFEGMTLEEFHAYVADFMATEEVEGFSGMTYGESFYLPMLEVINYLRANDFDVFVVTACEREVVRAVVEPLGIDGAHVIGSDWSYEATNQGEEEGLDYTYEQDDELVLGGEYLGETGKTNKVIAIQREIGKHPVLAFGNSSGDFAMLNYTLDNDEHPSAAFLVIADDTEREYGNADKAADMRGKAEDAGWTAISMRDDWSTIYGEGVEKTQLPADEEAESANAA
ncbi:MAG: haloacid dehalogenase-like hydrolase [Eggerthellaceae bacterium]|nr:haloacid dehalogenase-like hydrolase [Eggerthellaceae bacterium]